MAGFRAESFLQDLCEEIYKHLHEYKCEESPKARRYYRARHSIEFSLPERMREVEFVKGESPMITENLAEGKFYCCVPFTVERTGENQYIARDE